MPSPLLSLISRRIRAHGPLTVAEYIDLALYHPELGYYARAVQRSGRSGDFFTSVDLGPVFGELLAVQFAEMFDLLEAEGTPADRPPGRDLVEAAAGNGRLSRDVLDALVRQAPRASAGVRLYLVERSPGARAAQAAVLRAHAARLAGSSAEFPEAVNGVVFANELLDALPPHLVTMADDGLKELYVDREGSRLVTRQGPPSTPALADYLGTVGARLEPGWTVEVNLAAVRWIREAAARLDRGFLVLVDYGHEARELFSATHASGTLTTYRHHASEGREEGPGWLQDPGGRDITSHVDLTGVRIAAEAAGLVTLGILDQTYFLLALGMGERPAPRAADPAGELRRRLALKTLLLPGGLGSTQKVMIFAKRIGRPPLKGLSLGTRLT